MLDQITDSGTDTVIGVWPKRFILSYASDEGMATEMYTGGLAETGASANGTSKDKMNVEMGNIETASKGEIRTRALGKEKF